MLIVSQVIYNKRLFLTLFSWMINGRTSQVLGNFYSSVLASLSLSFHVTILLGDWTIDDGVLFLSLTYSQVFPQKQLSLFNSCFQTDTTAATVFCKLNISLNIRPVNKIYGSYNL